MKLTLAQLRAIEAVAREGHISRAAQALGVSQPAISTQIASFEAAWDIKLFQRDGYAIRLMPEAAQVLGKIRLALGLFDDIEAELAHVGAVARTKFDLGFSAHRLIMPVLSDFIRRYPQLHLTTKGAPSRDLIEAVKRGDLHLASVSCDGAADGLYSQLLCERPLVIYGPHNHPLLQGDTVNPQDLHGQSMVLWNQRSGTRQTFDRVCQDHGIQPDVRLIVDSLDVAYTAIAAGMGLGVAIFGEVQADQSLSLRPLQADRAVVGQYLICQKGAETRSLIQAFLEIAGATITPH